MTMATDGLVDGIGSDRLYAYSNLDILRVKQDIERASADV